MTFQPSTPPGECAELLSFPEAPVSYDGGFLVTADNQYLPPYEYRRPLTEKIPTPVDDRGLIDIPRLLKVVLETVEPEYVWPSGTKDHHFYWPRTMYEVKYDADVNPAAFRNLTIHKGRLPIVFENWLHQITLPAPLPDEEVMQARIESWKVAESLFHTARQVVIWERRGRRRAEYAEQYPERVGRTPAGMDVGEEYIAGVISHCFKGLDSYRSKLEKVPAEFRLCDPHSSHHEIARTLGEIILPRALKLSKGIRYRSVEAIAA